MKYKYFAPSGTSDIRYIPGSNARLMVGIVMVFKIPESSPTKREQIIPVDGTVGNLTFLYPPTTTLITA